MIGAVVGYVLGSIAADYEGTWVEEYYTWHTAFATQGFAMLMIAALFCFFDNKNIDILRTEGDLQVTIVEDIDSNGQMRPTYDSILEQIPLIGEVWNLLTNKMYMFITATITVILFSATGLQFWTISYMVVVMEIRPSTA